MDGGGGVAEVHWRGLLCFHWFFTMTNKTLTTTYELKLGAWLDYFLRISALSANCVRGTDHRGSGVHFQAAPTGAGSFYFLDVQCEVAQNLSGI